MIGTSLMPYPSIKSCPLRLKTKPSTGPNLSVPRIKTPPGTLAAKISISRIKTPSGSLAAKTPPVVTETRRREITTPPRHRPKTRKIPFPGGESLPRHHVCTNRKQQTQY
ncbi:hypothetical protein SLA2020_251280 [Shorea laevis]